MRATTPRLAVLLTMALLACERHEMHLSVAESTAALPAWYETGDVIDIVAAEIVIEGGDQPSPPNSSKAPDRYAWSTSDPRVAEVSQGHIQFRDTGQAVIRVSSGAASASFTVNVMPRITSLRLSSDSAQVILGGAEYLTIEPLDASGRLISAYSDLLLRSSTNRVTLLVLTVVGPAGVVSLHDDWIIGQWAVSGVTSGTARVAATVGTYRGTRLGDTATVVVR